MGLDSVELVMSWENAFGVTMTPAESEFITTPREATALFAVKLGARGGGPCLSQRVFHRLRRALADVMGVKRGQVRRRTRIRDLVPRAEQGRWAAVQAACGIPKLPAPGWFSPKTVEDLVRWAIVHAIRDLKPAGEAWTRAEVRCVVRTLTTDVTGLDEFKDDAEFIRDMGIDCGPILTQ